MISNELAVLAIETPVEAFPESALIAARLALLDALGCALAGQDAPGVLEGLAAYREWGGKPETTVWCHGERLPAPAAAFVNSVQLHALDFDDYHAPSDTHIGSVVWPVVLAVGEVERASGREALSAFILGVEVAGRLGRLTDVLPIYEAWTRASDALTQTEKTLNGFNALLTHVIPEREKILRHTRDGFSGAPEIAIQLIREKGYGGRHAHRICAVFVFLARKLNLASFAESVQGFRVQCSGRIS